MISNFYVSSVYIRVRRQTPPDVTQLSNNFKKFTPIDAFEGLQVTLVLKYEFSLLICFQ